MNVTVIVNEAPWAGGAVDAGAPGKGNGRQSMNKTVTVLGREVSGLVMRPGRGVLHFCNGQASKRVFVQLS